MELRRPGRKTSQNRMTDIGLRIPHRVHSVFTAGASKEHTVGLDSGF